MKRDVVNGFEYLIFGESEIEEARAKVSEGHPRVRIATTCAECHEPIETTVDNLSPVHSENYHASIYHDAITKLGWW